MFQTYDIILCDILYDYSHVPLHCPRNERKRKEKKRKREIKSNKIDKRTRKSK